MVGSPLTAAGLTNWDVRTHARSETGYTLAELLLVVAMVAIMAFIAVPFMLSYMPSATVNYAARELQSGMNRAKLTAVTTRQLICIKANGGGYEFWTGVSAGCIAKVSFDVGQRKKTTPAQ